MGIVVLALAVVAGCHGSSPREPSPTPKLDVVLRDSGLTFSPARLRAGTYLISFEDRRAHRPAGQHDVLGFGPGTGPNIVLAKVAPGTRSRHLLLANMYPALVINGVVEQPHGTFDFTVTTSPRFMVPAT